MELTVDADDLERLLDAYDRLAGEVEQLSAIEGIGECTNCSTPHKHCVRCGAAVTMPAVLEHPEFLDEITTKRLRNALT